MTDKVIAAPGGSMDPAPGSRDHAARKRRHTTRLAIAASTAALAMVSVAATADAVTVAPVSASPLAGGVSASPQRVGTAARVPAGAVKTGAPAGSTAVQLAVGLTPRDPGALQAFATAVSTKGSAQYHRYLAKGQFASVFGPTQDTIAKVTAALKAQGLKPGKVSADGLTIPVDTTLAAASRAFGTGFADYRLKDGTTGFVNTAAPQISGSVAADISGVGGLDTLNRRETDHTKLITPATAASVHVKGSTRSRATAPAATTGPQLCGTAAQTLSNDYGFSDGNGYYSAEDLAASYNMAHSSTSGAGTTIGVFELENYSASDLAAYQACYGTHVPVSVVKVDGGPKQAPNPSANVGVESLLDLEDVTSLAPGASVIDYEGPDLGPNLTDAQWLATYQAMVTDDRAQVLSISYGGCEYYTDGSVINAENYDSQEAAAQGQTIFVASGDAGANACEPAGGTDQNVLSVSDPASQPFVTGVGGTLLSGDPATSRSAWNSNNGGTGGGTSNVWSLTGAGFQNGFTGAGFNSAACKAASGSVCRQVPDVSALADPDSGYPVYIGGGWGTIGGTSGASPTWAALTAIADAQPTCQANGPLGYLNYALYGLASKSYGSYYTDITAGNNNVYSHGGYNAGTGYDLTTGLGEPNAATLTAALCAADPAPATGPGTYHPVTPTRLLDTRTISGGSVVPASGMTGVQIEGNSKIAGIPSTGVTAVVLNVTVTNTTGAGNLTAWGDNTTRPKTSNLNWTAKGQTISNLVTVAVPGDGAIDFYTNSATSVIADIQGYFTKATTGDTFTGVSPSRLLDTRNATGIATKTPITNQTVSLAVRGHGNVPADATAAVLNLTATQTTGGGGYIEAFPEGVSAPGVSNVNWAANGTTQAGLAIVPIGADGNVSLMVHGSAHVIADVFGYYTADATGTSFTGVTPNRILDTRSAVGVSTTAPITGGSTIVLQVTGKGGVPSGAKTAVLNVTVTSTAGSGNLIAWADGSTKPTTSNLNWIKGETVPNQVVVPIGADGKVDLYVNSTTHVIADVFGYYM
ncbi:S8/S53 family peptidase [Streptacidiphilus sp. PB12-B1b]|uniref:S53 family peptidase n=1 Tax=Streptacidiphilus sp. PB12-B1b TaxID=2705012 RepID=UPI0015FE1C33|nr:S53 family peptidase [Streptacidiphilus sp. PB12-B1b]QMU74617.1 S8/S53 family peptidase [Streptacidiphilus sp. PB12-B1b]